MIFLTFSCFFDTFNKASELIYYEEKNRIDLSRMFIEELRDSES